MLGSRKIQTVKVARDVSRLLRDQGEDSEGYWEYYTILVAEEDYDNGKISRERLLEVANGAIDDPDKEFY